MSENGPVGFVSFWQGGVRGGLFLVCGWLLGLIFPAGLIADEPLEYSRDIRPLLAEHCFACHGPDGAARQGGLRLDLRDEAIDSGAITAGDAEDSMVVERVYSDDPDLVMPPPSTKKVLSDEEKELIRQWINDGAVYDSHWAFVAPKKPTPPPVKNEAWVRNPIDHFVLHELEQRELTPAAPADPGTLYRRLSLDITGLPPQPAETLKFVQDYQSNPEAAWEAAIDQLLALPSWGEHRGRYWLDAARYADTHGMHFDNYREMWPYRDWVIRSFNANMPYDQFMTEQLAGDLLPSPSVDQKIATGFQRCNITTNEGGTIEEENLMLYAADRVQTFGWVFLGLTTNCCQCHDHKFDPITTQEYYSLAAFFRNTTQPGMDGNSKDGRAAIVTLPMEADLERWVALPTEIADAKKRVEERRAVAETALEGWLAEVTSNGLKTEVASTGLVVHARLNEGSGNVATNLGSANVEIKSIGDLQWNPQGVLGPAPVITPQTTILVGDVGRWEFDQSFSYGAWVKLDHRNINGALIARMDDRSAHRGWDLFQYGGVFSVHLVDSWPQNSMKVRTRGNAVKEKEWQHVFVTYDGSRKPEGIKIFIDGKRESLQVENNTLKPEASLITETPTRIGQRNQEQIVSGALIQDVRLYERQLTDAEVSLLAMSGAVEAYLATPEDQRSPEQRQTVLNFYLNSVDSEYAQVVKQLSDLEQELNQIRARSPITHVQEERTDREAVAHVLMRGEYDRPGELVSAGTPAALHPYPAEAPKNRLGLAQWLMADENPLTSRVAVNRFWQDIFGRGIVTTSEDFGMMGSPPSHPELLDWLAVDFRENGWDIKRLHKLMFMSATYRQSAVMTSDKRDRDADNTWLSRGPRFRMDGEMIRDLALQSCRLLSPRMYGPGVKPYQPGNIWDVVGLPEGNTRNYVQDTGENLYRRSVYSFWKRMAPPPNMEIFNATGREVCAVKRERTNTPLQALVTLNDPVFVEAARVMAEKSWVLHGGEEQKVLNEISQRVLNRELRDEERALIMEDLTFYREHYQSQVDDAAALLRVGESVPTAELPAHELAAWTMICNQFLNLDEAINK